MSVMLVLFGIFGIAIIVAVVAAIVTVVATAAYIGGGRNEEENSCLTEKIMKSPAACSA